MKLFLSATLAILLGIVVQVPRTEAGLFDGIINAGANIANGVISTGANMINGGINVANTIATGAHNIINWPSSGSNGFDFGSLLSQFGISGNLGGTTVINWQSIMAQGPNAQGYFDLGAFLAQNGYSGVVPGQLLIQWSSLQNVKPDIYGNIDIKTMLGQIFGSGSTAIEWNPVPQPAQHIVIDWNIIKNARPDQYGNVDLAALLAPFGVNLGGGHYVISWNVLQGLKPDASGNIDISVLLQQIGGGSQTTTTTTYEVNWADLMKHLGFGGNAPSTININIQAMKQMQPMADGTVDIGSMLEQIGISHGPFIVSYDTVKNLPTNAAGEIDLMTLLKMLNFNIANGPTSTNVPAPAPAPLNVDLDTIYQLLGITKGNKILLGIDTLKNLHPDSNGNVDAGPYLKHFGIGDGSFVVSYDVIRNLPSDASGKIDLLTLLEFFGIPFHYGGSAPNTTTEPITVNIDDLYQKMGFTKGSTVSIGVETLTNLHPDSYGHVDAGKFLQSLGIDVGSYIINYDLVKNLPSSPDGKIDILTLFEHLNIGFNYGTPNTATTPTNEEFVVDLDYIFNKLGLAKGSTVSIKIDSMKTLKPDSMGNVNIGPYLQPLGISNGNYLVNYQIVQSLPTDSEGKIDLLTLLQKLNIPFHYGPSTQMLYTVSLDDLYKKFGVEKGNTITMSIDSIKHLIPDTFGNVELGPFLEPFGVANGHFLAPYEVVQNLPTDPQGKIDILTLFKNLGISYVYGNGSPSHEPVYISYTDIYKKFGVEPGSTININIDTLKNLKPDSNGNVDVGPFLYPLGVGSGTHVINFDIIKNMPTDPSGNVEFFDLLSRFNITLTGEKPQKPTFTIDIQELLKQLALLSGNNGGQTITIDFNTIKNLLPNGNNEVDLSPFLQSLGFQIQGPLYVNYDIIKTMPTQPNGGIDLFTLIGKLSHTQEPTIISLENLYELLYPQVNKPGSTTITFNIQGLRPNEKNEVDISPILFQLGFGNFGPIYINFDTLKQMEKGPSGDIDLVTLLATVTGHPVKDTTTTTVEWNIDELLNKIIQTTGSHTITINFEGLKPNSQNQVDIGPLMHEFGFEVGPVLIDYNIINSFPKGPTGGIDLTALLQFLKDHEQPHHEPTTITWTINGQPQEIDLGSIISQLNQHNGGHTVTINVNSLIPDKNNQIDLAPILEHFGINFGGSFTIDYNILNQVPKDPNGDFDLSYLLELLPKFPTKPVEEPWTYVPPSDGSEELNIKFPTNEETIDPMTGNNGNNEIVIPINPNDNNQVIEFPDQPGEQTFVPNNNEPPHMVEIPPFGTDEEIYVPPVVEPITENPWMVDPFNPNHSEEEPKEPIYVDPFNPNHSEEEPKEPIYVDPFHPNHSEEEPKEPIYVDPNHNEEEPKEPIYVDPNHSEEEPKEPIYVDPFNPNHSEEEPKEPIYVDPFNPNHSEEEPKEPIYVDPFHPNHSEEEPKEPIYVDPFNPNHSEEEPKEPIYVDPFHPNHSEEEPKEPIYVDPFNPNHSEEEPKEPIYVDPFNPNHGEEEPKEPISVDPFNPNHTEEEPKEPIYVDPFHPNHSEEEPKEPIYVDPNHNEEEPQEPIYVEPFNPNHSEEEPKEPIYVDPFNPNQSEEEPKEPIYVDPFDPNHTEEEPKEPIYVDPFDPNHTEEEPKEPIYVDPFDPNHTEEEPKEPIYVDPFDPNHSEEEPKEPIYVDPFNPNHGEEEPKEPISVDPFEPTYPGEEEETPDYEIDEPVDEPGHWRIPNTWRPTWNIHGNHRPYPLFFYQLPDPIRATIIRYLHGYPGYEQYRRPHDRLIFELLHELNYVPTFGRNPMDYDPIVAQLVMQLYATPTFESDASLRFYLIHKLYDTPGRDYLLHILYDMPTRDLLTIYLNGSPYPMGPFNGPQAPRDFLLKLMFGSRIPYYMFNNIYGYPVPSYPQSGYPHFPHGFPHGYFPSPVHGRPVPGYLPSFPTHSRPAYPTINIGKYPSFPGFPTHSRPAYPTINIGKYPSFPGFPIHSRPGQFPVKPSTIPSFPKGSPTYPFGPIGFPGKWTSKIHVTLTRPSSSNGGHYFPVTTYPSTGTLPSNGNSPSGSKYPTIGHLPSFVKYPSHGNSPSGSKYPTIGNLPSFVKYPSNGNMPSGSKYPTTGLLPTINIGHLPSGSSSPSTGTSTPTIGNLPSFGKLPAIGNFINKVANTAGQYINGLTNGYGNLGASTRPNFGNMFGNAMPQPQAVHA